jgi:hypothetical protein
MGKELKTSALGRKCQFPRCTHVLSIYNHNAYCHVHLNRISQQEKKLKNLVTHPHF